MSLQVGLETQTQLTSKLEEAHNKIKSLENQLDNLKIKEDKGDVQSGEERADNLKETDDADPSAEDNIE